MGGSASVCCATPSKKVNSAFVDETLLEGEAIMKLNAKLRTKFVEYIKGEDWVDSLIEFEDRVSILAVSSESTWKRFGYKTPHCSGAKSARSSFNKNDSFKSLFTVEAEADPMSRSNSVYSKMVMDDCYTVITSSQLFLQEELRCILIASLLPLFLKGSESTETADNSGSNSDQEDEETSVADTRTVNVCSPTRLASEKRPKTHRLQEWLLGAAAMFDSTELEAYLADLKSSWIDDYLKAIHSLPVTVTLSAVDHCAHESKIAYANASRCGLFGCKSQIGENIHEIYGEGSSGISAEQVERAIFTAKKYKRSLQEANGMCRLRALKPVFDPQGQHVYVLGLESYAFEDPILLDSSAVLGEEPFQQLEDLMLMLPMLVRNFNPEKCK